MKKDYIFEVCANSVGSVVAALEGGAQRVELCAGMPEGGTTPSYGMIKRAKAVEGIRLNVIIRPRGGDFLYSGAELDVMCEDIFAARSLGADGLVFGVLTPGGEVDMAAMKTLMVAAGSLPVTFHRAFDMVRDPFDALEKIISLGCKRILTSGGRQTAEEGIGLIRDLAGRAGDRIIIMPGSGVNAGNIKRLAEETGCREFHFSGRVSRPGGMIYRNTSVSMGGMVHIDEYAVEETSSRKVRDTISAVK
ncbi:copper homeostasis protein CutC [Coprobacter tertius]|uniref:PF03932 family protein CutC n=1 Tax=Coprobacter tertius TaxID=2944915 RepID=A0ABT1MKF2_9BACT|nr:copper homeostasis protein CutC [Coprobacter tertius]MCP9613100.1 copper homeostasis protein CutC [Coprobacter tertius]